GEVARWWRPDFMSGRQSALERPSTVVPLPSRVFDAGDASQPANAAPKSWWREMPAWTQVAAAMLVFGVSAGLANINVHYDAQSGLNVRTGWGSTPTPAPSNAAGPINTDNLASRAELAKLEEQLREIRSIQIAAPAPTMHASASDADTVRRLRTIIDESERRQQREIALRVAELIRDINAQRASDLRMIDRRRDESDIEVLRTQKKVDLLLQRVSLR